MGNLVIYLLKSRQLLAVKKNSQPILRVFIGAAIYNPANFSQIKFRWL